MAGFEPGASPPRPTPQPEEGKSTRLGYSLFVLYLLAYTGFMLLNAFAPDAMEATPFAGLNVAVLYGLGLILLAFALAVFYDLLCSPASAESPEREEQS